MKVVVAGGSGLIGRALTAELAAAGIEVTILSRRPSRVSGLPEGATAAGWDGRSAGALAPRLEGATALVNLVGENIGAGRWTSARKAELRDSRIQATTAIVRALKRVDERPAVLMQASAVGFYGPRGDEELTESEPGGADFLAGICRDWEAASSGIESHGVRRVVLRTGVVLASDGGALEKILLPFKLFAGGRLGSGRQWLPWIHLRDEVRAIRFLLERDDLRGAFNLSAPNPVTNRDLARVVGRIMGRPSSLPTPAPLLRLAMGEMAALVLEGQRAVPQRLLEAGLEFEFPELEPALRDLLGR